MKVILLKDVEKVGREYDIKEVSEGYGRNFLIPRKLAKVADEESIEWAEKQRAIKEAKAAEQLKETGKMVSRMDGLEVEITMKVGDKGQLFERVNPQKIASRLKEMGYNIAKNQIELKEEIDGVGDFEATVKFEHGLEAQIKVIVRGEETKEEE